MDIYKKKAWAIGVLVGLLLAIYLFALAVGQFKSIAYIGSGIQPTDTISVDGSGDAYAIPDVATFSFTVMDTEKAVADAQTKAATEMNAALKVVSAAGVADKDVQTTGYSISPQYQYQNAVCPLTSPADSAASSNGAMIPAYCPPGKQTLLGYEVSQSVSVKLRDLTKAGALLASLGSAGVTDLYGPSFEVDNPDSVRSAARSKAIADAQSKARELAKELGVHIVRIVSFSDNNGASPQPIMYAMNAGAGAAAPAAAPELPAGQQKVTDTVTITYEIQ